MNTAIEDVYSSPYDQVQEQLGLAIESLRERQESQLINNDDYGLLKNVADSQRIQTIENGADGKIAVKEDLFIGGQDDG